MLIFGGLNVEAFGQTATIKEMISRRQTAGAMMSDVFGLDDSPMQNAELTSLSAIKFPNAVKVEYLSETRKLGKIRKKAVDKWLKDFGKTPADKKFYVNETLVAENNVNYWIIAKESVLEQLKARQKNDSIVLKLKILGYYRKGSIVDYFLMTDGLE